MFKINFKKLYTNFLYLNSINLINQIINFIIIVLIARNFSNQIFGQFAIAQTIFLFLYSLSFHNGHILLHKSNDAESLEFKKKMSSVLMINFYVSLILYLILLTILFFAQIEQQYKILIGIVNFILIIEPFTIFYSYFFLRENFKKLWKIKIFIIITFAILKIYSITILTNIYFFCILLSFESMSFAIFLIRAYLKIKNNNLPTVDLAFTKQIVKKIFIYPFLSFFSLIALRVDIFMIGIIFSSTAAGYYSASTRIVTIYMIFFVTFHNLLYPKLANYFYSNKRIFNFLYTLSVQINFFACILILTLFVLFGDLYLSLYGTNFLGSLDSLLVLSFGVFLNLTINTWQSKKLIESKYFEIILFQLFAIVLNIILNIYLMKIYYITGAAIATTISGLIAFLIVVIIDVRDIRLIYTSLSFSCIKRNAREIFKAILIKKNPEKKEKATL